MNGEKTGLLSAGATKEDESSKRLSKLSIMRFVAPGAVPQMGWCLSEAVIIPLFLSMGVSANQLNFVYAIVPLVSLFLHPACGVLSDRWGYRRPFIFVFYIGFLIGISMIVLLPTLFSYDSTVASSEPPLFILLLLLGGTCLQDLSLELITDPTRALLNDNLPESQLSQGNSYYSLFSDMACILTFTMSLSPLEKLVPSLAEFTSHPHELALYFGTIFFSGIFILLGLTQKQAPEEEAEAEPEPEPNIVSLECENDNGVVVKSLRVPADDEEEEEEAQEEEGDGEEGDGEGDEAEEEEDDTPGLRALWSSIAVLPKAVFVLWCFQYCFVHVTVQLSFWWPTYVGVEIFGGSPGQVDDNGVNKYQEGVNFSVIGLLLQATCSFLSGNLVVPVNIYFGVANAYILAGLIFGTASMTLFFYPNRALAMCFMGVSGIAYPFLQTNPFILLELLMRDDVQEAEATAVVTTATENAPSMNAFLPTPLSNAKLDGDDTSKTAENEEHYSLDATRGALTSFVNMTLPAAQISGAAISYLGVTYLGDFSSLFLVAGLGLTLMSLVCFFKGWLTLEDEDEELTEEEEEEEEEEEVPEAVVEVDVDSTTDDEYAEMQRHLKEMKAKRKEEKRAAREQHKLEHHGKHRQGPFLLPRTKSDAHTSGTEGSSSGERRRRRREARNEKKNAEWRLYGDGNLSAPDVLPSRRISIKSKRSSLVLSPTLTKDKGYMTFDESVRRHTRQPSDKSPDRMSESKLMDRRSKQLRKINAERRRAKRIKAQKQEATYFQQRHARGQVWLPPAADSEATVASEIKKRMEKARELALTQQRFGLIASKQRPGAVRLVMKRNNEEIDHDHDCPAASPWVASAIIENHDLPELHLDSRTFSAPIPIPSSPSSDSSSA